MYSTTKVPILARVEVVSLQSGSRKRRVEVGSQQRVTLLDHIHGTMDMGCQRVFEGHGCSEIPKCYTRTCALTFMRSAK